MDEEIYNSILATSLLCSVLFLGGAIGHVITRSIYNNRPAQIMQPESEDNLLGGAFFIRNGIRYLDEGFDGDLDEVRYEIVDGNEIVLREDDPRFKYYLPNYEREKQRATTGKIEPIF